MPVSILSNLSTRYAQQAIQVRNEGVTASTQKLSSGLRVFSADQDPVALAIGTSLKVENAALKQAQLNVTSGASMLQIADGAMNELGNVLTRMQALATQASSGQLGQEARGIIDREFQTLKAEVDRIAGDTEFNGVFMLKGQAAYELQGGAAYAADGVKGMRFNQAMVSGGASFRYQYDATTEQLTLSRADMSGTAQQTIDLTGLLNNVAGKNGQLGAGQTLDVNFSGLGVTMTLGAAFDRTADIMPVVTDNTVDVTLAGMTYTPAGTGVVAGVGTALQALGGAYSQASGQLTLDVLTNGTTVQLAPVAGIRYAVDGGPMSGAGAASADLASAAAKTVDIYLDDGAGGFIRLGQLAATSVVTGGTNGGTLDVPVGQGVVGVERLNDAAGVQLSYVVGTGIVSGQDRIDVTIPPVTVAALGLTNLDTLSGMNADVAIDALKTALTGLSQSRAAIGAQQLRMESVGRNLQAVVENNEAARSALLDVDPSEEITNLTNDQAMMQVGVSMLSQSNRMSDMLLQMLRDA